MRVSGKVTVDNRFRQYQNELDRDIVRSLGLAAGVGIAAARAKSSKYRIDKIKDDIKVTPVVKLPRGYMVELTWPDFRARFMDKGTYQKLGRRLTARSKAGVEGNRGVKPQRFSTAARSAGRLALIEALRRNLR